ncbi:nuclease-related domain-containing protein [Vibrio diabolicus]|uniref:nuclease-related domain-containing protein n=1 Tax=Vibrio diabolicus TaxID=50719 RepID=UPI0038CD1A63
MLNTIRGWFGEKKTAATMWMSLNTSTYQRFHDLYIPTFHGTAQIDHLLISPFGIFIVETKNHKGWIFGDRNSQQWTQLLFGKKYRFQNPLRQAYRQKKALAAYFGIDEGLINTIVYFSGDCELKTELPANVLNCSLARHVKRFKNIVLTEHEIDDLLLRVHQHIENSTTTRRQHVKDLRSRHNSTSVCPRCGSSLVKRVARSGPNVGKAFLGCESFPQCRFTKN